MADNRIVILALDESTKEIFAQVTENDGTVVSAWGKVSLMLGKDPGTVPANPGHTMGKEIKFRETLGCDAEGAPAYCIMLRSEWYATPLTSNPEA
jgi:hypothetical protein